jgi:hypothetical protein
MTSTLVFHADLDRTGNSAHLDTAETTQKAIALA